MDPPRITDGQLLDYLAGRLEQADRERLERLLSARVAERRRLEELRQTWHALGSWQVDAAGLDVLEGVRVRLRAPAAPGVFLRLDWRKAGRVAAMWLAAITVGATAGRLAVQRGGAVEGEPPSEEAVVNVLRLDVLGGAGAGEAIQAILESSPQGSEEVGR
jgi:anti-sigma factor RsiW